MRSARTASGWPALLREQLCHPVRWRQSLYTLDEMGVTTFVEIGPGKVLTGLIKRIAPEATALATDDASAPGGIAVPFIDA